MNPKRPWECADMGQVRAEIDRIDDALVDLIAERFGYVDRAWQVKWNTPEGAVVKIAGLKHIKHRGPARVFNSEEPAMNGILSRFAVS